MRKQSGFSLIELLIVVAIILIIAAIAIPNLMRSKMVANQSAAAANLRTIISSQQAFAATYPSTGYAGGLFQLGPGAATCTAPNPSAANACLIDFQLGCAAGVPGGACVKENYRYTITGIPGAAPYTDYVVFATATGPTLGRVDYCANGDDGSPRSVNVNNPPSAVINTVAGCAALAPL
ncbi:MAG TPA: prepilin-type N-terminal cleavage/methylation domain-containing protein [Candidatus Angelobacter sp.]